ncbi:MAG: formylglycine-generating enzyme family protein, partial [SAR324 cluster bacterium]|nr:formylglycine-generating enzyme family protein [SAR324 cluster bacterium]
LEQYPKGQFVSVALHKLLRLGAVTARPTAVQAPPGMVRIKPGTFQMGNEEVSTDAVHAVSLQSFYLDQTEVTQQKFQNIMKFNPSRDKAPNQPVEKVTWFQAQEYCKKVGKRMPTEAEWEYAARAGTTTKYSFGKYSNLLMNYGNYCGGVCAGGYSLGWVDKDDSLEIAPVKKYKPNPWGIHDMHGNVAEWVNDWYGGFQGLSENNPTGPESGNEKVVRGGSWKSGASETASASRDKINPSTSYDTIGFRCAADAQ